METCQAESFAKYEDNRDENAIETVIPLLNFDSASNASKVFDEINFVPSLSGNDDLVASGDDGSDEIKHQDCASTSFDDPYVSFNTQVMDILDDLDHALESSLKTDSDHFYDESHNGMDLLNGNEDAQDDEDALFINFSNLEESGMSNDNESFGNSMVSIVDKLSDTLSDRNETNDKLNEEFEDSLCSTKIDYDLSFNGMSFEDHVLNIALEESKKADAEMAESIVVPQVNFEPKAKVVNERPRRRAVSMRDDLSMFYSTRSDKSKDDDVHVRSVKHEDDPQHIHCNCSAASIMKDLKESQVWTAEEWRDFSALYSPRPNRKRVPTQESNRSSVMPLGSSNRDRLGSSSSSSGGLAAQDGSGGEVGRSLSVVEPVMCDSATATATCVRRDSMRHLRQLPLPNPVTPSAPPPTPPPNDDQLPLPVLLFMERHSTNYSPARSQVLRPSSADTAPRVLGRRALANNQRSVSLHVSPSNRRSCRSRGWRNSAGDRTRSSSASSRSRTPRSLSSDSCSISSVDSTAAATATHRSPTTNPRPSNVEENPREIRENPSLRLGAETSPLGTWPHGLSSMLACLGCTIGIFNISRFSIFSVHFGANFIIQFLILSLVIGIPLFTLHLCLGQLLCAGPVDMWRISPLFQGVGIALLIAQSLIGIYSIIGISWLFVYFRDSFITKMDRYRWAEPFTYYRDEVVLVHNGTFKLSETVPDYFNGVVLNRHNIGISESIFGNVKFQLTFNLAVVWMIVFVSLSKGLRSYGKVAYVFSFLPICGTLVLCAKLLSLTPHDSIYSVFPETSWSEFFLNSKSWAAAAQEAFLTWGLLGACVMQLSSHNKKKGKPGSLLQRDSACIIILTIAILLLSAFLANTCIHIINHHGYNYMPGSFEHMNSYIFLRADQNAMTSSFNPSPVRYMTHQACLVGTHIYRPAVDASSQSGYQVLQLATELVPSTLAIVGPDKMSSFWAVLFYFILIMFGVAQQLAIWHCVITGIMAINIKTMKSWETTVTFFSCAFGFTLGLPMTTDAGIQVVHFLDYVIVGGWWHCLLYVILIVAVFLVRGRPYAGDTVVTALYPPTSGKKCSMAIASLLSFTWNVILPITMIALCVIDFRLGKYRQLYTWKRMPPGYEYWTVTCKKLGAVIQLLPILAIPITGFIQTWRYITSGPPDILDRIQLLYRPSLEDTTNEANGNNDDNNNAENPPAAPDSNNTNNNVITPQADPPPKYTPPPSYSTATGARIAKMFRQSLRRSIRGVRRLASSLGESSSTSSQIPMSISESVSHNSTTTIELPPPDYSLILNNNNDRRIRIESVDERNVRHNDRELSYIQFRDETDLPTVPFRRVYKSFSGNLKNKTDRSTTPSDVANLLRSSIHRSLRVRTLPNVIDGSFSQECLINQAEPISHTTINLTINAEQTENRDSNRNISNRDELENTSSVI